MPSREQTGISCSICRSRKRRCDKRRPICSLCSRKNLRCIYTPQSSSQRRRNPDLLQHQHVFQQLSPASLPRSRSPAVAIEERTATPEHNFPNQKVEFPSVVFLDFELSQKFHVEIPKAKSSIPTYVSSIIGAISHIYEIARSYFEASHPWMPIISKKRFYEHVNPLSPLRSDYALLILCMDLISWVPGSEIEDPRTTAYLAAKRYYLELEIAGVLSIQALQACVLLATFEIGHAIYPSALLSVAACARYGSALGLNSMTFISIEESCSWLDAEEQNRLWWAIVILDRTINIGHPERPLLIPDPGVDVFLPCRDTDWDRGEISSTPRTTVTTPSIKWGDMGPFALVAQTTRLLSQVLRHISSTSTLDEEDAILLDRALRALAQVVDVEGQLQNLHMMNQQTSCSAALIMLYEAHATQPEKSKVSAYFRDNHPIHRCNKDMLQSVAAIPERRDQRPLKSCVKEGSPFLTALLYQMAVVDERIHRENGTSESLEALNLMKMVLRKFDTRWKSAGAYLKVLKARELMHMK